MVCSFEVVEHVIDQKLFIDSIAECIKPGGSIFLSSINKTPESYLAMIVAAEKLFGFVPEGTHEYNKFIDPFEI